MKPSKSTKPPQLFDISEVLPHLFLAGYGCITENKLKQFGITHCVNATNLGTIKTIPNIETLEVPVEDTNIANIAKYFEAVSEFIEQAKQKNGKVVVYCAAGVSRSSTLVIIYLVIKEGKSLKDAYYAVNQVRPIISPNIGFWRQMIDFEMQLRGEATVSLLRGRMSRPVPDVYLHRSLTYNA